MARGFYGGHPVSIANPQAVLSPTRPYYLDLFWRHFKGRGYNASQGASNSNLSGAHAAGATALTVVDGSQFQVGECVLVGSLQTFQSVVITAINGNTLTIVPPLAQGFATNTPVTHAWGNDSHPNYTNAYVGFAQAIVDATVSRALNGPNLLGPAGDFETWSSGLPVGWTKVGNPTVAPTTYATADNLPQARSGSGAQLTASAKGDGLASTVGVGASAGNWLGAAALVRHVAGAAGFRLLLTAADDANRVLAASDPAGALALQTNGCLGALLFVRALVPCGGMNLAVRLVAGAADDVAQVDDVRLVHSRVDPGTDPPVIPDPGSRTLACIGTSWGVGVTGWPVPLKAALEAKYGHPVTVLNACVSGNRLDQMVARFDTDILPAAPFMLLIEYGVNDLSSGRSQALMEADADAMIAKCRANGIIPVFTGIPPMQSQLATANARNDQIRARCDAVTA